MKPVYVHGVGLAAPGLPDWQTGQAVFRGDAAYQPEPLAPHRIRSLPPNEARRAGQSVRLAFQVAEQACAGHDASRLASVFASAAADTSIADRICIDLADPARSVSPTQFHNSVHNTAAGYWGIASGSREPANSLTAGRDSFSAALLEAWAMLEFEVESLLLVCFDAEGGGMLNAARPSIHASCALALLLSRNPDGALARLADPERTNSAPTPMRDEQLELLRRNNPSAGGFGVLNALINPGTSQVVVESSQGNLALAIDTPASG